nr:MAG TPA: hypothetical protein [Caudoviricetes sp.]
MISSKICAIKIYCEKIRRAVFSQFLFVVVAN